MAYTVDKTTLEYYDVTITASGVDTEWVNVAEILAALSKALPWKAQLDDLTIGRDQDGRESLIFSFQTTAREELTRLDVPQ